MKEKLDSVKQDYDHIEKVYKEKALRVSSDQELLKNLNTQLRQNEAKRDVLKSALSTSQFDKDNALKHVNSANLLLTSLKSDQNAMQDL